MRVSAPSDSPAKKSAHGPASDDPRPPLALPELGLVKRHLLRLRTPLILGNMAALMMQPSAQVVREYGIPKSALREAYRGNRVYARARSEALGKTRALCAELGLVAAPYTLVWRQFGILRS